jgi:uncharacterized protein involved in exopolysaccharide biosynthesis
MVNVMAQRDTAKVDLRVAEELVLAEHTNAPEDLHFPELLLILAKRKSFIIKFVAAAGLLAVVASLLLRNTYTAETKVMPPQQNQPMSTTAMLSQLGPLAALAGQSLGLRTPSDLYVSMLRSDTVADAIIDRFSLMNLYNKKRRVDTRKELERNTLIVAGKDGVISVSVDDRQSYLFSRATTSDVSQQRAADMANAYVDELEKLTRTLAVTEAGKRRAFFERETKMAMDDLANAEQSLKETQEKTGLILLEPQSRAMIDALTSLRARVAAQEVLVQSMRAFATSENPDLIRAQQELSALKDQVAHLEKGQGKASIADVPVENVPTAGLEYLRKLREVKYREALFELLAKQYEAAKIDEARDALIVQQLDKATKPEKKSGPLRAVIVLSSIFLALLGAGFAAFFMERLERAKEISHFASQLQLFMFYLGRRKA